MTTINRIPMTVTGNTSQIEYRTTRNGMTFARFSVAQQAREQDQDGRWVDGGTTWIRVSVGGPIAEHMQQSGMTKGARVTVVGWYEQREYQDEQGQRRTTYELRANEVAASLLFATVQINKTTQSQGGYQQQGAAPSQPQQGGYQQNDYQYDDGFAPQPPQI
ncbi:single-stranded DNA-binding protein [Bifidobacterium rousetti]|uniref:single-stranded DNA-binding protein n=1 Tax=Bifidobacterium rousetti TaxID=2045439 RepID=UPI00123A1C8C|nr:single-stranded DNA-binding protein [Bifidobacterium rousetti]KAA8815684.1 single-stranded DNA-binding protein [Bifidobacterium rousetti]